MAEQLREWFDSLLPRERWLVSIAGLLLVASLVWLLLIQPVFSQKARAEQRISDQQLILLELGQLAARAGQAGAPAAAAGEQSLVVLIDRSARARGLSAYLRRNQPDGPGTIRLRLENVPFDPLVEWLAELQADHGLGAVSVTVDPAVEPGRVNSNIVLSLAGG
ncbi:MAG: type II secretion system protein M [Chromatiales bacterium]|nr:type II secretion system protein M [Chromatiales bacterium]